MQVNKFVEPKIAERDIKKSIMDWLTWNHFEHWPEYIGGVMQRIAGRRVMTKNAKKGFPDIAGLLPNGRFFGIETKTKKNKPSKEQLVWHERLRKSGAIIIVARSINDVEKLLKEARGY